MNQTDKLIKELDNILKVKEEKAKKDIIGAIYVSELMRWLGYDKIETADMKEAWKEIETYFESNIEKKVANDISELITHFGNRQEEFGFKAGFNVATRLFVEGMRGGAY